MATRGKTTFEKRRKEMARKEKQNMKAERRAQRKLARTIPGSDASEDERSPSEPASEERES